MDKLSQSNLMRDKFTILWHAGEPLSVGIDYYKKSINIIRKYYSEDRYSFVVQTNGLSINKEWVKFFKKENIRVGLSLDGPAFLNDINRVTKSNKGTFSLVISPLSTEYFQQTPSWSVMRC